MSECVGLIGTITHDVIRSDRGKIYEGLGGVLYQAAVFCGLKMKTLLYTNIGEDLTSRVNGIIEKWPTLNIVGVSKILHPSNLVHLYYPDSGERIEILKSVVPPIEAKRVLDDLKRLNMLVAVCNSGFDITREEWRKIIGSAGCPVWLDIHSLALSKVLGHPRRYVPLPGWKDWIRDVTFVQVNQTELSSMIEYPDRSLTQKDFLDFGAHAFELGVKGVFITLGRRGVFVMTSAKSGMIPLSNSVEVTDTTGCGDVFGAATVTELIRGADPFAAARFGVQLATHAAGVAGIEETHALVSKHSQT